MSLNLNLKIISLLIITFLVFQPLSFTSAQATTTTYPSKYYNIDSNGKVTKHIFANGVEIATIEGTGDEAKIKYIHTDNLGSTNVVTDETGAVVETLDYLPFGGVRVDKKTGSFSEQRKFIGEEYDADTKLNYLNARYYDSATGRFLSEDPAYWALPQELLLDPQQQNSYSYARNNPINLSDPSGLLTVVVPGTYYNKKAWSTNGNAKDFISAVGKTFGESPTILNWSGRDNIWARKDAANSLTNMIKDHDFVKGEKLNIVGHSHGGNIAILASQMVNRKIDNLVTLGTPARSDYQPNYDMIGNHVNVYNASDGVQQIGGSQIKASGIVGGVIGGLAGGLVGSLAGLIVGNAIGWGEVGSASRTFSGARNMTVPGRGSSVSAHSNLWSDLNVWSTLSRQIK